MTERRRGAVESTQDALTLGPSRVVFEDGALVFEIAERGMPFPRAVRGRVVIRPEAEQGETFILDRNGGHAWRPVWPRARVEARFDEPDFQLGGDGYVDMNAGTEPLEAAFSSWHWSRAPIRDGAAILYDCRLADGGTRHLALRIDGQGKAEAFSAPRAAALPSTGWRIGRETRSEGDARVLKTLEDTPFYARSLVETGLLGAPRISMHESLDLRRFSANWVKLLLPFRMRRAF